MIDWARAQQLQDEVGSEDFDEVIDLFFEEVGSVMTQLENLQDRADLSEKLHFLKGSALSLGFQKFYELCHEGETVAAEGQPEQVDVEAVIDCYSQSKTVFMAEYQEKLVA